MSTRLIRLARCVWIIIGGLGGLLGGQGCSAILDTDSLKSKAVQDQALPPPGDQTVNPPPKKDSSPKADLNIKKDGPVVTFDQRPPKKDSSPKVDVTIKKDVVSPVTDQKVSVDRPLILDKAPVPRDIAADPAPDRAPMVDLFVPLPDQATGLPLDSQLPLSDGLSMTDL